MRAQLSVEAALTGRENVAWFARLFDVPRSERKARVADALETMALTGAAANLALDVGVLVLAVAVAVGVAAASSLIERLAR